MLVFASGAILAFGGAAFSGNFVGSLMIAGVIVAGASAAGSIIDAVARYIKNRLK